MYLQVVALAEQLYPEKESGYWQAYFKDLPRNFLIPEKIADKLIEFLKKWGCVLDVCEEEKTDLLDLDINELEEELPEDVNKENREAIEEESVTSNENLVEKEVIKNSFEESENIDDNMVDSNQGEEVIPSAKKGIIPYWDNWKENGFFTSLWGSWSNVLFKTDEFFKNLPQPRVLNLLIFYLLFASISVSSNLITFSIFLGAGVSYISYLIELVFLVINFFIAGMALHFSIYVFGKPRSFKRTLQIVAYSSAANIFLIIPVLGVVITFYFKLVLYISGVVHGHKFSVAGAVGAVLLPIFALIFFIVIVFLAILLFLGGANVEKSFDLWRNLGAIFTLFF